MNTHLNQEGETLEVEDNLENEKNVSNSLITLIEL